MSYRRGAVKAEGDARVHAIEDASPNKRITASLNPLVRLLFRTPLGGPLGRQLTILRFSGRRSGKQDTLPVGQFTVQGRRLVTCRQAWQHNFDGGRDCEVFVDGRCRPARAERVASAAATAGIHGELMERYGWEKAPRRLGLRVMVGRPPTGAELEEAVRRLRLSIIYLDPMA